MLWVGCLLICLIVPAYSGNCQGRNILNSTTGRITDGPGPYLKLSYCEWLIEGSPGKYIILEVKQIDTECSYDYLFVFDGKSYNSPIIGSFSGDREPEPLVATSGFMLIYFFSDRNYVRDGFDLEYTISDCPYCNGRGLCDPRTKTCTCSTTEYGGDSCEKPLCPNNCNSGTCDFLKSRCNCQPGYTGVDCSLATNSTAGNSTWYTISPTGTGFEPRVDHAGSYFSSTNTLWLFGGHGLNSLYNDLMSYTFTPSENKWNTETPSGLWPEPRYGHTAVGYNDTLYIYGGTLQNEVITGEFWSFNTTKQWTQLISSSANITSHTMTLVEDRWIYIFGGRTPDDPFTSDMYRIDLNNGYTMEKIVPKSSDMSLLKLVGHSAVYHKASKSLIIFGGITSTSPHGTQTTNNIYAYHIDENYWSRIYYAYTEATPTVHSFHSANIMGDYMVIYGGITHIHKKIETCHDNAIYLYHLGCHTWTKASDLEENFLGRGIKAALPTNGRISHVTEVINGNILVVSGGFRGHLLGDLIAYKVPPAVASNQNLNQPHQCDIYSNEFDCTHDVECGWCTTNNKCFHRTDKQNCTTSMKNSSCPGICSVLHDCHACIVQGQGSSAAYGRYGNDECVWCSKEIQCQKKSEPSGVCRSTSPPLGWWSPNNSVISSVNGCTTEDEPAGLHWISYYAPVDYNRPDKVSIVKISGGEYVYNQSDFILGDYKAILKGFIHPLDAVAPPSDLFLKIWIGFSNGQTVLYLNHNSNVTPKNVVVNVTESSTAYMTRPVNPSGEFFKSTETRYYTECMLTHKELYPIFSTFSMKMYIKWNGNISDPNLLNDFFSANYLEPFSTGSCTQYTSCMGCMTDMSCGWCKVSDTCELRSNLSLPSSHCGGSSPTRYLVTNASHCSRCDDYVDCSTCTQNDCEWLAGVGDDGGNKCYRKGRHPHAQGAAYCKSPCHQRHNCTVCLTDKSQCVWCTETQTCFPFNEYLPRHIYGSCTRWLDTAVEKALDQCLDCSQHDTCGGCRANFQCGWCGNVDNPTIGRCYSGDFLGPSNNGSCSILISEVRNISSSEASDWSYGICPDVEECRLGLDNCHENATCSNTPTSFTCECNQGFEGDGASRCDKTCYYECENGECSGAPDYECMCDLGWTGVNCSTDCGCYKHSTCPLGEGTCHKCHNGTTGLNCDTCLSGYYGDPLSPQGCSLCHCNGHGVIAEGICNPTTGVCICGDSTLGDHCSDCQPGYYGIPLNGNVCYRKCDSEVLLANITQGALGSHQGTGTDDLTHMYCLWILTPHVDLETALSRSNGPPITFTVEKSIKTECSRDYVHIYDGIPPFLSGHVANPKDYTKLASVCGQELSQPISAQATSGILTVFFEVNINTDSTTKGFNATYYISECPSQCPANMECQGSNCVCREGWGGVTCDIELCPANCSSDQGYGVCNMTLGLCVCNSGWTGPYCNTTLPQYSGNYNLFNDLSRLPINWSQNNKVARSGHSVVSCDSDNLYLFGGYSDIEGMHNDVWKFSIGDNTWQEMLVSGTSPSPRYFHTAVCIKSIKMIYIFGGLTSDPSSKLVVGSNELWRYSIGSQTWTQVQVSLDIPPMAGHSMTLVTDTKFIILGGFSLDNYFNNKVLSYETTSDSWRTLEVNGTVPTGHYGHSAVYHSSTHAIYIFGGYLYTNTSQLSSELYSLDLLTVPHQWHYLPHEIGYQNKPQAFHTAITTDQHMILIGGRTSHIDYFSRVTAYRYQYNSWSIISQGAHNILGSGLESVISPLAVQVSSKIYIVGGFNGVAHSTVVRLSLPDDLCLLHSDNQNVCIGTLGCSGCFDDKTNQTFCFAVNSPNLRCANSSQPWPVQSLALLTNRNCGDYLTCRECLSVTPAYRHIPQHCQWCSNCNIGKCIIRGRNCSVENPCPNKRTQKVFTVSSHCVEMSCRATDCDKCRNDSRCMWTRQFKRSSELNITFTAKASLDFHWNCHNVQLRTFSSIYTIESMPPLACPARCYQHVSCDKCLGSSGSEGGPTRCVWSEYLNECMTLAYLPLRCSHGECGFTIIDSPAKCPVKCSSLTQCSKCLLAPHCGWCAIGGTNGIGVCMEGGVLAPTSGICSAVNITLGNTPLPALAANYTQLANEPPSWNFFTCPPENECTNMHHTCTSEHEICINMDNGFQCNCTSGYSRQPSTGSCKAVCFGGKGCNNGRCTQPDTCVCNFHWVGANCSTECQCNNHSACQSELRPDVCLDCKNNTQGMQCEQCKPYYVMNATNHNCVSCLEFCNHHSNVCLSQAEYNINETSNIKIQPPKGPNEADAVCVACLGNTQDKRCGTCIADHFRLPIGGAVNLASVCQECQCQGHGYGCNPANGRECKCQNNTRSECPSHTPINECYKFECNKCGKDGYEGNPINGHQCFKKIAVDTDFCLSQAQTFTSQYACLKEPLYYGRTKFFAIQPKYLNVDIRIAIDVSIGSMDIYFTPKFDSLILKVDPQTGVHTVHIDPSYQVSRVDSRRRKRNAISPNITTLNTGYLFWGVTSLGDISTYITVSHPRTILVVHNVTSRVVITLPLEVHDLKSTKFYVILVGTNNATNRSTYGNLFFRQDQTHIDLFCFFSVFFPCFFLFLSMCVLIWKLKQTFDQRASRLARRVEMAHMASRPFSGVLIYFDPERYKDSEATGLAPLLTSSPLHTSKGSSHKSHTGKLNLGKNFVGMPVIVDEDAPFSVNPISIEPTDDGIAVIGSVVIELPGGLQAPAQTCLGSSLMTMRVRYPNSQSHKVRRRTLPESTCNTAVSSM